MSSALQCIRCDRELDNVWGDRNDGMTSATNQPSEGTTFYSPGQYGSTAFDPMDGTELEINVCDECLKDHARRGQVLAFQRKRHIECEGINVGLVFVNSGEYPWDPDKEYDGTEPIKVEFDEISKWGTSSTFWRYLPEGSWEHEYLTEKSKED